MPDFVVIYGPNGEEIHTPLNAREYVLHVPGYSYGNGWTVSPVDSSPYAQIFAPPGTPEPAQAALGRYGGGAAGTDAPPAPTAPVIFKATQAPVAPQPVAPLAPIYVSETTPAPVPAPVIAAVVETVVEPETADTPEPKPRLQRAPKPKT